jgi:hypothetical protein
VQPQEGREDRPDVDHEHDGVPHLPLRRQLAERIDDRLLQDRRIEQ